jgi:hypothetical protein
MASILVLHNRDDGNNIKTFIPISNVGTVTSKDHKVVISLKESVTVENRMITSFSTKQNRRTAKETLDTIKEAFIDPGVYTIFYCDSE